MNNENIEEILKNIGSEKLPADIQRIAEKTSENFGEALTKSRQTRIYVLGDYIIKSRFIKLAAAGIIIIGILTAINQFRHSNSRTDVIKKSTSDFVFKNWIDDGYTIFTIPVYIEMDSNSTKSFAKILKDDSLLNNLESDSLNMSKTTFSMKVDSNNVNSVAKIIKNDSWPDEYTTLDMCKMPVLMDVGMYVQIKECNKAKVELLQVDCADIGKSSSDFPCYSDCEEFEIRANFNAILGLKLVTVGSPFKKCTAWFDGDNTVPGDSNYHKRKVCIEAWTSDIQNTTPDDEVRICDIEIIIKPN